MPQRKKKPLPLIPSRHRHPLHSPKGGPPSAGRPSRQSHAPLSTKRHLTVVYRAWQGRPKASRGKFVKASEVFLQCQRKIVDVTDPSRAAAAPWKDLWVLQTKKERKEGEERERKKRKIVRGRARDLQHTAETEIPVISGRRHEKRISPSPIFVGDLCQRLHGLSDAAARAPTRWKSGQGTSPDCAKRLGRLIRYRLLEYFPAARHGAFRAPAGFRHGPPRSPSKQAPAQRGR